MSNKNIKHSNSWVKTPTVFQMENAECGAACLGMILSYYGKHVSLEQLRVECGVSKDGCNALNIFKAGEMHDLEVKSFKYSIEDLKNQKEPCIIHWEFNHFVVFEGIKNDIALINDPAIGRRKISLKKLGESFTGVVLTFSPTSKFKKEKGNNEVVDFLLRRLSGQKNVLGLLIAVGLILVIIGVLTSSFSKIFIDNILVSKNVSIFWSFLLIAIFTICFSYLFSNIKNIVVNKFQLKLSLLFGHDLIRRTLKLPISFYEQRYAGDLSQRINNNDVANSFLSGRLTGIFLDVITAAFYLIFMLMFSIPLTLVSILGLGLSLLLSYKLIDVIKERIVKLNQDAGKLNGLLFSGIEIASTLKACGIEDRYVEKIVSHYSSMGGSEQKNNRFNELINLFPSLIIQLTNISILIIGAYFVVQGDYTIGLLSAFGVMFGSFSAPVNSLFGLFQQLQNLKANLMRVNDIENYQIDDRFKNKNIPSDNVDSALKGKIEIKHLNFGYNKVSKPVIEDFNLEIEPGEVVAIVGPSGCGKSTILKLLGGLYQPWNGEILFDGKKAEDYSLNVLNASVSTINQDSVMFAASVKENLTFWNTNILDSDIVSASKDACIYDAVSLLPTGFNHKLSQGGKNLSGGQRQRLEIARALVNNPSILLMDEATSSLDPIVEKDIMHNIKKRGCTCVIVAHRLSTIRDADKILCIKNGRVVQLGTHNELKSKNGLYKDLIKNI